MKYISCPYMVQGEKSVFVCVSMGAGGWPHRRQNERGKMLTIAESG